MLTSVESFFKKKPNDDPKAIYRAQGKNFFLTYPKMTMGKQALFDFLQGQFKPHNLVVCQEKHEDGSPHCHAVLQFSSKKDYSSCKWADVTDGKITWHGYYTTCRSANACIAYVMKADDYIMPTEKKWLTPFNFVKEKADWDAWIKYREYQQLQDPFPTELFDEMITKPANNEKKCNWIFVAPPDYGKTFAIQQAFENKKVYVRVPSETPYDDYEDEDVILFDDNTPQLEELLIASNCYKIRTPVVGRTRYKKRYWKLNQRRVIIIVCNEQRVPSYINDDAFTSRFNIRYLSDNPNDIRQDMWLA